MTESLPDWFSVMKWWLDLQPCCLLSCYCFSSCCVFMRLVRISHWITPNNKSGSVCFSWAGQLKRENESQTSNCVSGGKFQDFGYLMKILSLDSFPMWCQNGRRVNVWTVYWRPTLNSPWVCVCVSSARVSARLFSYRGHAYLDLRVSSLADSRRSAQRTSSDITFTHWLLLFCKLEAWTEESGDS